MTLLLDRLVYNKGEPVSITYATYSQDLRIFLVITDIRRTAGFLLECSSGFQTPLKVRTV